MTGTASTEFGTTTSQTQLTITNSSHPLAAGLSGTLTVVSAASSFAWGKPNANAVSIATLTSDSMKKVIFGYDKDATMPGLAAPARRVGIFLTDTTGSSLNSNGTVLFDAAIKWAAETNASPTILTLSPTLGLAGASITITGRNFGATQGASTATFNGRPASITSWSDKTIVATVPPNATTGPVIVTVDGIPSNGLIFAVGEVDSDGDGLPDSWETLHFGNLNQTAGGDPDGDGLTNLQEFQLGRNPTKGAIPDNGTNVNLKVYTPLAPSVP
jgi:IPT/TIG domain/Bacterial TSP3 repeat